MKVYGNVDTKDVASFALFGVLKSTEGANRYALYHEEQESKPVTKKDLIEMIGKAPIMVLFVDDDGVFNGTGAYATSYDISKENAYGILGIQFMESETIEFAYTVEYEFEEDDEDEGGGVA